MTETVDQNEAPEHETAEEDSPGSTKTPPHTTLKSDSWAKRIRGSLLPTRETLAVFPLVR